MLNKYVLTKLVDADSLGGATKPFLGDVEDEKGNNKGVYVIKIFAKKDNPQGQTTLKEIFSYFLAQQFGLDMPSIALIFVPQRTIDLLVSAYGYKDIEEGYYFGSEYMEHLQPLIPNSLQQYLSLQQFGKLLCFDLLIQNSDRNSLENLLIQNNKVYIIDHNMTFAWLPRYPSEQWEIFYKLWENIVFLSIERQHISSQILKSNYTKLDWQELETSIKGISLRTSDQTAVFLAEIGIKPAVMANFYRYIRFIRAHSQHFISHLKLILK